jgi:REP element-mobilizing transposase RayT
LDQCLRLRRDRAAHQRHPFGARFLQLLGELAERFGLRVHAYVLMDNHYHLLVETREANLSRAMQWLNVSYSVWFNRRHDRVGFYPHLFDPMFLTCIPPVIPRTLASR